MNRIAVYAGTFDPVTRGHLSVIERAAQLFDRMLVVVAQNPTKMPLFPTEQRLLFLGDAVAALPNVTVASTSGLVVDFARAHGARFLVRGIRGATDAEYEAALAHQNQILAPGIQSVFLPADPQLSTVSSSGLKALADQGGDIIPFCTPLVARALRTRLQPKEETRV